MTAEPGPTPRGADPANFLQQLLTVEEVARLLALKPSTVRTYAERGSLPCVRIGNRLRFRGSDVGLWIARRFEKGGA
jgi:excisionase family DNA binding protein